MKVTKDLQAEVKRAQRNPESDNEFKKQLDILFSEHKMFMHKKQRIQSTYDNKNLDHLDRLN